MDSIGIRSNHITFGQLRRELSIPSFVSSPLPPTSSPLGVGRICVGQRRYRNPQSPPRRSRMSISQPSRMATTDNDVMKALRNKKVVITGGTGLIGRALLDKLAQTHCDVYLLSRSPQTARMLYNRLEGGSPSVLRYDAAVPSPISGPVYEAISTADIVINLAGEPVDEGRWTTERKVVLFNSRVRGTKKIVAALQKSESRAVLISASAVGYYGTSETKTFEEEDAAGKDFLATTAAAWEDAALEKRNKSRTVVFRIGVVLANGGGALEKMSMAFKAFLGGVPGGGSQWFSWVHIEDIVRLILHASVDGKWDGVYNATAPQPVRLGQFCQELARALGRPNWLPVPRSAIQALMGNEAAELILAGQQVVPKRVRANGFVYRYKDVGNALQSLIRASKSEVTGRRR